jgi:hypothetical protein
MFTADLSIVHLGRPKLLQKENFTIFPYRIQGQETNENVTYIPFSMTSPFPAPLYVIYVTMFTYVW